MERGDLMEKEICGATTTAGTPCKRQPGWGTDHLGVGRCRRHGGASPQAQVAGVVELARREMVAMGRPLDVHPHDAILECIRISAGEVQYASERVAELELNPPKGRKSKGLMIETMFGPQLNVWIKVRQQAMDRLVAYSATALKAGVDERRITLAENQGKLLAQVIDGILRELGVRDRPEVPGVVRRHLSLVASAA